MGLTYNYSNYKSNDDSKNSMYLSLIFYHSVTHATVSGF